MKKFFQIVLLTVLCGLLAVVVYFEFFGANIFINKAEKCYEQNEEYKAYYYYNIAEKLAFFDQSKREDITNKKQSLTKEIAEEFIKSEYYCFSFDQKPLKEEVTLVDSSCSISITLPDVITVDYQIDWQHNGYVLRVNNVVSTYLDYQNGEFSSAYSYMGDVLISKEYFAEQISAYIGKDISEYVDVYYPDEIEKDEMYNNVEFYSCGFRDILENQYGSFELFRYVVLNAKINNSQFVEFTIEEYSNIVVTELLDQSQAVYKDLNISYPDCFDSNISNDGLFELSNENGIVLQASMDYFEGNGKSFIQIYMDNLTCHYYTLVYPNYSIVYYTMYDNGETSYNESQIDLQMKVYSTDIEEIISLISSLEVEVFDEH